MATSAARLNQLRNQTESNLRAAISASKETFHLAASPTAQASKPKRPEVQQALLTGSAVRSDAPSQPVYEVRSTPGVGGVRAAKYAPAPAAAKPARSSPAAPTIRLGFSKEDESDAFSETGCDGQDGGATQFDMLKQYDEALETALVCGAALAVAVVALAAVAFKFTVRARLAHS